MLKFAAGPYTWTSDDPRDSVTINVMKDMTRHGNNMRQIGRGLYLDNEELRAANDQWRMYGDNILTVKDRWKLASMLLPIGTGLVGYAVGQSMAYTVPATVPATVPDTGSVFSARTSKSKTTSTGDKMRVTELLKSFRAEVRELGLDAAQRTLAKRSTKNSTSQ